MAQARPALEMRGISKTFPGVKALRDVSLAAYAGEVLALMGARTAAGKSTLMKILSWRAPGRCGWRDPDRRPGGRDQPARRPRARARDRHHLPGTGTRAEPHGGREHLSRRRDPWPSRPHRPARDVRQVSSDARAAGHGLRSRDAGGNAVDRRAAARGDRARAASPLAHPGARRADHGTLGARNRQAVRDRPAASGRRHRARLYQPSHGRGSTSLPTA